MQPAFNFEEFASILREFIQVSCLPHQRGSQELDTTFERLAVTLFRQQFSSNAAYRRVCQARGVGPGQVTHWSDIPALPTVAFKEFDISCLVPEARRTVFHSSGTTERQPGRHYHDRLSLSVYESSLWPWFVRHLMPELDRGAGVPRFLISLIPPPGEVPHSSLGYMLGTVVRNYKWEECLFVGKLTAEGGWAVDAEAAAKAFERATDLGRAVVILGTAFSFVHLLDRFGELGLRFQLPQRSRVMETGGYKGRSRMLTRVELHALIMERLGVGAEYIVCEYGMTELSSQAYDRVVTGNQSQRSRPLVRAFHFPPWARAQVISPETGREVGEGETGLIRVYDLANLCSVLAVQTEDLGIRRGSGFELIGRAKCAEPRGCSLAQAN